MKATTIAGLDLIARRLTAGVKPMDNTVSMQVNDWWVDVNWSDTNAEAHFFQTTHTGNKATLCSSVDIEFREGEITETNLLYKISQMFNGS